MITKNTSTFELMILRAYHGIRWTLKRVLDAINFIAIVPSYLRPKKDFNKDDVKRILLINLQGIGDLAMMTPLIESIKMEYKPEQAIIDILCSDNNGELFINDDRINIIRHTGILRSLHRIRRERYDIAICPYRAEHAGLLTALSRARCKIGYIYSSKCSSNNLRLKQPDDDRSSHSSKSDAIKSRDPRLNAEKIRLSLGFIEARDYEDLYIKTTDKDANKASSIIKKFGIKDDDNIIVFNTQNKWLSRSWPMDNWIGLANDLLDEDKAAKAKADKRNNVIFIIGSRHDHKSAENIRKTVDVSGDLRIFNVCGEMSLTELIEFLKKASMFITTDSGPMHLGFIADVKTITLFGSTIPGLFLPKKYLKYTIWKNHDGRLCPLYNHNNEPLTNNDDCMSAIKVEDVLSKVHS